MWIQNISYADVSRGNHRDPGTNAMMINIVDCGHTYPIPKCSFKEIHRFEFLDAETKDRSVSDESKCSQAQANQLVALLQHALTNDMNVVVSCHAGLCRSGAVVEVGVMMGFTDTGKFRSPNLLVKHRMMACLKLTYDSEESPSTNGNTTSWGFILPKS